MTTYKVTGLTAFQGHEPGEVFEAELDEELEARAIARGSIKKTTSKPKEENGDAEESRSH